MVNRDYITGISYRDFIDTQRHCSGIEKSYRKLTGFSRNQSTWSKYNANITGRLGYSRTACADENKRNYYSCEEKFETGS